MTVKKIVKAALGVLPGGIQNKIFSSLFRAGYGSMPGLLNHLQSRAFEPRTIIDIGAFHGEWSSLARAAFPSADIFMIDGNDGNSAALARAQRRMGNSRFAVAVLGPETKAAVTFYQLGTGSSVLPELTEFAPTPVTVPMRRLDEIIPGPCTRPLLMKLDVQGYELEVLRGGSRCLDDAEVVILETSILPYNQGAPSFVDVVTFMTKRGFVAFDFCGQHRRETDAALFQVDVAFARRDSMLLSHKHFWLAESRCDRVTVEA